jgi:hypothetical protein
MAFIKHGNVGKSPANQTTPSVKAKVQKLVREKCFDFNMLHCLEKLKAAEGIEIPPETFRMCCHEIHMVKRAKKRRKPKARRRWDRMQQTGIMLQMNGSPHYWYGGKPTSARVISGVRR